MGNNFEFLKKEDKYISFSQACIDAENSIAVSYSIVAVQVRRALELSIKWVYSFDNDLKEPYQDKLSSLIYDYTFRKVIDSELFPRIKFIQKLGNRAAHTPDQISRGQAVLALRNLYQFVSWIDYCYSEELHDVPFDEGLLESSKNESISREEMEELEKKLSEKDTALEKLIKENETLRESFKETRINNIKNREYKVESISEFKTRKLYIDLELQLKGWTIGDDCLEEVEVSGMPNDSGVGYVDYVLYGDDGIPLAVLEAKKTSVNPNIGKTQAQLYANCLEKEHGKRPLIFYTNGFEYYLWDDLNYPERRISGIYTKRDLQDLIFKRKNKSSHINPMINEAITDRPYQKLAINAVCESLGRGERKALLVMATGSGKTRTAISIIDILINRGWVKNALFLADRRMLVKQAKNNFRNLLPELSLCNLLDSKDSDKKESRMIFSTYPTMMNSIDKELNNEGDKIFSNGHFDMIIVDESHRSIYKKYQAIFDYYDSILLGLTATPRNEIDKNTYEIFDLENNVPTFAYELDEAIRDGYLVPYHTVETKIKFIEDGIHYDDLSEEEKELFEDTFEDGVKDIDSGALNEFLFNNETVDMVLQNLMERGIKIEGGDKLGKTIIFAKNKKHADFIIERFNVLYPEYRGNFAKSIYTGIRYADSTKDDFATKEKLPQIAVSVDMLDTGIDIPEVVNLVFFKRVRSKTKFWQMIGRGTRLCEDLFGPGIDKTEFKIFDYCGNFEFFRVNKNGKEEKLYKSLTENHFNVRIDIIRELQHLDYQTDEYKNYRDELIEGVLKEIKGIDEEKFHARMKLRYIHKFNKNEAFEILSELDTVELSENIAPLLMAIDEEEFAKRFDFLMYSIELGELKGVKAGKHINKVVRTAEKLAEKGSIQKVRDQQEIIRRVQTDEYWNEANIFDHEMVRKALRDLIKFIDSKDKTIYYTNFHDEILQIKETRGEYSVNDMKDYRKKVNQYLKEHMDDSVINKIRYNMKLEKKDIKQLEKILWHDLGTEEDYRKSFGDEPLLKMVINIVGLDKKAVNEIFSKFISDETLNSNQMEFVKMIVNYVQKNGIIEKQMLNQHPFTKYGNITNLFKGKIDTAKDIIKQIDELNRRITQYSA